MHPFAIAALFAALNVVVGLMTQQFACEKNVRELAFPACHRHSEAYQLEAFLETHSVLSLSHELVQVT